MELLIYISLQNYEENLIIIQNFVNLNYGRKDLKIKYVGVWPICKKIIVKYHRIIQSMDDTKIILSLWDDNNISNYFVNMVEFHLLLNPDPWNLFLHLWITNWILLCVFKGEISMKYCLHVAHFYTTFCSKFVLDNNEVQFLCFLHGVVSFNEWNFFEEKLGIVESGCLKAVLNAKTCLCFKLLWIYSESSN